VLRAPKKVDTTRPTFPHFLICLVETRKRESPCPAVMSGNSKKDTGLPLLLRLPRHGNERNRGFLCFQNFLTGGPRMNATSTLSSKPNKTDVRDIMATLENPLFFEFLGAFWFHICRRSPQHKQICSLTSFNSRMTLFFLRLFHCLKGGMLQGFEGRVLENAVIVVLPS